MRTVGESGPKVAFVSSTDLIAWGEGTHFDAASQLVLGPRYAQAVKELGQRAAVACPIASKDTPTNRYSRCVRVWLLHLADRSPRFGHPQPILDLAFQLGGAGCKNRSSKFLL